jgi:hypothetical protein
LLSLFLPGCIFVFKKIPVESLNTDRWSVIVSFWNNYFDGKYVYDAQSHMGNYPGPMPFYFILALPFYWLGELGFFSLMGVFVFYILMRYMRAKQNRQTVFLLLILSSPFYFWEVMVRSNIFLNATLVFFSIVFFFNIKNYKSIGTQLGTGLVLGLLMSTRNVFVLCYIILFLYSLKCKKINMRSVLQTGCVSVLIFALTFLPFVIGHWDDFLKMNPFIIQSSFLMPFPFVLVAVCFSFVLFLFCRENSDVIFYSGITLFFAILLHLAYHAVDASLGDAFWGSNADISYFILCIPFFLLYICLKEKQSNG